MAKLIARIFVLLESISSLNQPDSCNHTLHTLSSRMLPLRIRLASVAGRFRWSLEECVLLVAGRRGSRCVSVLFAYGCSFCTSFLVSLVAVLVFTTLQERHGKASTAPVL